MKPISTEMHGVLDYLTAAGLFVLPRLLRWNRETTRLLTGAALSTAGYSLLTDYELGAVKVIPMRGHLALDVLQSLVLGTAPFLFLKNERQGTALGLLGISLFEALVVINSDTEETPPIIDFL